MCQTPQLVFKLLADRAVCKQTARQTELSVKDVHSVHAYRANVILDVLLGYFLY